MYCEETGFKGLSGAKLGGGVRWERKKRRQGALQGDWLVGGGLLFHTMGTPLVFYVAVLGII